MKGEAKEKGTKKKVKEEERMAQVRKWLRRWG